MNEALRPNASSSKHSKVDRQKSAMEAQALSKKRKRQPVNGVRSAYGQRIQDAPVPPTMPASRPSSKPGFSRSSDFNFAVSIRTRAASRAEAAAIEAATIESAAIASAAAANPAATPAATTSSAASSASAPTQQKRYRTRAASAAGAFENDEDANTDAKVNKTAATVVVVVNKPTTAPAPPKPRTTTLSAHKILTLALLRLCANTPTLMQRLNNRAPWSSSDPRPRLRIRPLFDDVRSGRYGAVDVGDVTFSPLGRVVAAGSEQEKAEKKKRRDAILRGILDRVVRDTRDGTDALANAGYFLLVLVEVQRCCVLREEAEAREDGGGGADAGGADEYNARLMERVSLPWMVEAVFKMIVILVSWQRPLVPRGKDEEGKEEDEGCVLSTEQLVALVEGEVEEAVKLVEGLAD
ncbi:ATP-dependent DNA helicase srs2 [Diplodia intermedia]|uniref:ATP-dependent DNA helicase srs2 n=1 Tax=Diplodia intermedia TaxID=856260 RepID=A0ABR3TWF1_9PEZI